MDTNFKLNDRHNSDQLSDRIINSADEVFEALLSDNSVQKFLMKGEINEENLAIAHRRQKDAIEDLNQPFGTQLLKNLSEMTDNSDEKQFFVHCIQGFGHTFVKYCNDFEQLFGKVDPNLMSAPMTHWVYSYKIFCLYNTSSGHFLKGLIPVFAMFMVCDRTLDYLKQNPNYLANNLAKMLLYEDYTLKQLYGRIRQMIDCRADQVSEKEEQELKELFRRAVAYERLAQNHNYNGGQWFDG